jgi:hypothetical protein
MKKKMTETVSRRKAVNDNRTPETRKYKNVFGWIVLIILSIVGLYITFY